MSDKLLVSLWGVSISAEGLWAIVAAIIIVGIVAAVVVWGRACLRFPFCQCLPNCFVNIPGEPFRFFTGTLLVNSHRSPLQALRGGDHFKSHLGVLDMSGRVPGIYGVTPAYDLQSII
jgi:hypothetical protein